MTNPEAGYSVVAGDLRFHRGLWRLQQQRWEGEGLVAVAASDDDGDNEDGSELGFRDFYFFSIFSFCSRTT